MLVIWKTRLQTESEKDLQLSAGFHILVFSFGFWHASSNENKVIVKEMKKKIIVAAVDLKHWRICQAIL